MKPPSPNGFGGFFIALFSATYVSNPATWVLASCFSYKVCSFLPMLSMFNDTIGKVAKYFYSEQLNLMINQPGKIEIGTETILVLGINVVLILGCFIFAYRNAFVKK